MFKSARSRLRAAVFACAAALGLGAYAATVTGYEDFGDVAGVVLYRATQTTFHNSTVINVADDGTLGTAYAMDAGNNNTTSWKRFASNQGASCYTSPGIVLVYDEAGSYTVESDAQFGPMSFGGIWVKSLAANDAVFVIKGSGDRKTEFGAADKTTLFKFDKSFKIDRQGTFSFLGTVNLAVAQDAVFTINPSYPAQSIVVASGSTLAPSGAGTITLNTAGLTVNGTLDLTASTLPTISGNVALNNGSSLVLPAGIATGEAISVAVCSGTLSSSGVISVKIGTADPINAALTVSGGAITQIDEVVVEKTFTSDYPSVIPAGYIYTFTTSAATTLPDVTVNGTLKTEGDFTITDLKVAAGGALEVVSGNTTVGGAAACQIKGNVTVDAGATLTNTLTDSLDYNGSMTVDIYGTLAMGSTRWSIPSGCTFNLRGGASVTGTGDTLASLDIINANGTGLNVWAGTSSNSVTIEGPVRVRANETRIWVASGTTLVLQSGIVEKNQQTGSFRQTGPGTLQLDATSTTITGTSAMTQGTLRLNNTTRAFPLELHGTAALEIVATDAATTVPVNVTSINGNGVTLTGSGKANGTITKTAAPSGNLATFLQSSAWEGTFVADWAGAHGTRFDINSYGNANSTVRVTKLVGGYASDDSVDNFTVIPTVEVSGFMTLDNGYSGKVTTLTKLTGSGVFTNKTYSVDVTTLDNFTGTLATLIGTQYIGMRIGTINLSSTPAAGVKIVNVTSDSNIGNIANTKVSVNGVVDDTIALEVKSDGIYVAVPATTVDITIPEVANATVSVTADGVAVTPVNGVVTVDIGAAVVVTYTAAEGYQLTGDAISFTASASTTTVDVSSISVAAIVANVTSADGQTTTPYTSAASAIAAADDGETVTLLENTVTLAEILTVSKSIAIASGNASGTTITGSGLSVYPQLAAANLTVGANVTFGSQLRVTSSDATITYPTGSTLNYRPPSGCQSATTDNGNGTTTITFYQQIYVVAAGTNATLADENGNQLGSFTPVAPGDTFVFTVTPAAGCTLVRVTADGVELTPSEGKYSISIGSSTVSIYAVAGAAVVTGGDSDEYCSSLQAAVDAATSGQTVKMLADVTLNSTLTLPAGKTLTMDLGGFTIYSGNDSSKRIVVNGAVTMTNGVVDGQTTVYDPNNGTAMIRVNGSLTLGANLTIRNTINAVAAFGTGSLTVNGATINALGFAISTNGSATGANASNGTVLAINSGTITSTDVAVYLPSGTMTINGGTITGSTGVYAKGGSLSVPSTSTAVITGNGANAGWSFNGNGANSTGDALVIDNSAYPYGPATATIAGGTYESTNGDAIGNYTKNAETLPTATGFVSGGTFSNAVAEEFCAEGFEPKDNGDGTYGVREDKGWVYSAPGYWDYTGTWTEGAALGDDKVTISDGATYSNRTASAGQLVTINLALSFDAANSDDDVHEGAKAAVRLGEGDTEGTYVFQLYTTNETGTAAWLNAAASGVTPTIDQDYAFTFVLDMTNKTFTATVDGVALTVDGAETLGFASANASDTVQSIEFTGSGKVSSIEGSYEDVPVPEGFAEDDTFGDVTLTAAQAEWLNGQANYDALAAKIATMDATAFNNAYLLNLDILDESYQDYQEGDFVVTDFAFETESETEYVVVEVTLERHGALDGGINGTLKLTGAMQLGGQFETKASATISDDDFSEGNTATLKLEKSGALFYKPVIE